MDQQVAAVFCVALLAFVGGFFLGGFILLAFVGGFFLGGFIGRWGALDECREEAKKAGVGRWEINPRTGERRFVYGRFS